MKYDIGFVGCGNMARAIINGLKQNTSYKLCAYDVNAAAVASAGVDFVELLDLVSVSRYLVIAVKPFHADDIFKEIAFCVSADTVVISIMAGFEVSKILAALPNTVKVVRVMPNLAAQQLQAMSALCFSDGVTDEERKTAIEIFASVGRTVTVGEDKMNAVTAVSGSGTAYVYEFIQHMVAGGVACGLSVSDARALAVQTVKGAAAMVESTDSEIEPMIDAVCSKGGTTIEAIKTLRALSFGETVEAAVKACYDRAVEMGKN